MDKLKQFHTDKQMMNEVYNHTVNYLKRVAIMKVFKKENTESIADALFVLEGAFAELDEMFSPPKKPTTKSSR